jgi:hypothetical protein
VVEATVGQRAAQALVKEQEQQRDLYTLVGEAVGVARAVPLQQAMAFQFSQVVAELVQAVGGFGKLKGGEDGFVDLFRSPSAEMGAGMKQHLQQADDARLVDVEAGFLAITDRFAGPISQPRSKILWMGKLRLKMKLRQYSIWAMA